MNRMSGTRCILKFKESLWLIVAILSISVTLATSNSLDYNKDEKIYFLESDDKNENVPPGWNVLIYAILNDNQISDPPLRFNEEEEAEMKNSNEDINRYYDPKKPDAVIYIDDNEDQPSRESYKEDSYFDHSTGNSKNDQSVPSIGGRNIITVPFVCPPGQRPDKNKRCRIIL